MAHHPPKRTWKLCERGAIRSEVRHRVYKYFTRLEHAQSFLDGNILFRSLAYFRDIEDAGRGDEYEGTSKFRPVEGLTIYNQTRQTTSVVPFAFESSANAREIFVYCVSRTFGMDVARQFNAVACVEITNIPALCGRIKKALPSTATFKAGRVEYYPETQGGTPRWALPDMIALSKLDKWASQNEYRFVFSLTDALDFEKVQCQLTSRKTRRDPNPEEHICYPLNIGSLRDIAVLCDCAAP